MSNTDKCIEELENKEELEKLYQIYMRVQSGNKAALDELFKTIEAKQICKIDESYKRNRMSNMDNVLDMEWVLENEKNKQENEWTNSADSKVAFQFSCLNKLLFAMKKDILYEAKSTGYKNTKKNGGHKKFYAGKYDVSDFNELMYGVVTEIFNKKTDENNYLTLDGKKNVKYPICDGISLLKNISYFTSRKINKRAKNSCLEILDIGCCNEESDELCSYFDKKALKDFLELESWQSEGDTSRISMYADCLEWLKRNDIHKLFKNNACDIRAIIDTIINRNDIFIKNMSGDNDIGFGMRLAKQETLQNIIQLRHSINIGQEDISRDLKIIEQRLLDQLFYSLNYKIGKAKQSKGIYEKESERHLYKLDEKRYIKMFSRTSYILYNKSFQFIDSNANSNDFDGYFKTVKKYENMAIDIVSLEKGKKKYDMVNLILENDDMVDNKNEALSNIADTVMSYYQSKEEECKKRLLEDYKIKGFTDWVNSYWEAELKDEVLKIRLRSNRDVKNPIRCSISRENLIVYCGYMNFYICNTDEKKCYCAPKNRRVISRSNKSHEISIYDIG